jgi:CRISPR-associated protein Csd2
MKTNEIAKVRLAEINNELPICRPAVRHDVLFLFDVINGNPNGDPDNGNMPRMDIMTGHGFTTDVSIKRKLRDFVANTKDGEPGFRIYVSRSAILANMQKEAYDTLGLKPGNNPKDIDATRKWMCENFWDVRMFGAVMTTGKTDGGKNVKWNCGQVHGPCQFQFSVSVDSIYPVELPITRVALTNADDIKGGSVDDEKARSNQMGRKTSLGYGLYKGFASFDPLLAKHSPINPEDLATLWTALARCWMGSISASSGLQTVREILVFTHDSALGNAQPDDLYRTVKVERKEGVGYAQSYDDYEVAVDVDALPEGITLTRVTW